MESNNMVMNRETLLSILKKHLLWLNGDEKNGKQADLSEQDSIWTRFFEYIFQIKCLSFKCITLECKFKVRKSYANKF